jgi:uncharacterized protein
MRIAMHDLKLDALYVVYPGLHRYPMGEGVEAVPLWAVLPAANGHDLADPLLGAAPLLIPALS